MVVAIPEVQSDSQFFNSRFFGFFGFHRAGDYTPAFSFLLVRRVFIGELP